MPIRRPLSGPFQVLVLLTLLPWVLSAQVTIEPEAGLTLLGEQGGPFESRYTSSTSAATASTQSGSQTLQSQVDPYADAIVLATQTAATTRGTRQTRRLIQTNDKYPFLLVESESREGVQGREATIGQVAMAAEHLIVQLKPGLSPLVARSALASYGFRLVRPLLLPGWLLVEVPVDPHDLTYLQRARATLLAGVCQHAQPDYVVTIAARPNDTDFHQLWGLHNTGQESGTVDADIDAPEAWDLETGDHSIAVGVIDTGIDYHHPDLAANIWTNPGEIPGNGLDDDGNGFIDDIHGWNFYDGTNDPMDDNRHGTHVAGTIGAVANNSRGVAGVAHQVSLVAIKFLSSTGSGFISDAADAIEYATQLGLPITNNSWTGSFNDPALADAIRRARDAGSLFVAAAGNSSQNIDSQPSYPAAYDFSNIISVAATTRTDSLSSFSNYGVNRVDLAAPGSEILSTLPGDSYGFLNGTSMATPHVTGVAVLLKARFGGITTDQVIDRILATVDPLASLEGVVGTGGRLNAYRALTASSPDRLVLFNSGATSVSWQATEPAAWLSLSPTSGTLTPGLESSVQIAATPAANDLPPGTYSTTITFEVGEETILRNVYLVVQPVMTVSPTSAFITGGGAGGPFSPATRDYVIANPSEQTIDVEITRSQNWIVLSDSSYSLAPDTSRTLTVSLAADSLPIGSYSGSITIANQTNGFGTQSLAVELTISEAGHLSVTPATAFEPVGEIGGPFTPASKTYTLQNTGGANLQWAASTTATWLSLGATSGVLLPGSTVNVSVSLKAESNQLEGRHQQTLTFHNLTNGSGTTTRWVNLHAQTPGTLAVSPLTSSPISGIQGGPFAPISQAYTLTNTGELPLSWTASTDTGWLDTSGGGGDLAAGAAQTITLSLNEAVAEQLPPDTYTATLTVVNTTSGLGDTTHSFSLEVLDPAQLEVAPTSGFRARSAVQSSPFPRTKSYFCTNTGQADLDLLVSTNRDWLIATPGSLTLAPGQTTAISVSLGDTAELGAGEHTGLVTFTNAVNGVGTTTRTVTLELGAASSQVLYRLSLSALQTGADEGRIRRRGFLVLDRENRLVSLVMNWRERRESFYQVQSWSHEIFLQNRLDSRRPVDYLTALDLVGGSDLPQKASLQLLQGRVREDTDLSSTSVADLGLFYRGDWLEIDLAGQQTTSGRFAARLLRRETIAANDTDQTHDDVVANLAAEFAATGASEVTAADESTILQPDEAAVAEAVTVYDVRAILLHATADSRERERRDGYLVLSRGTWQATLIIYWQDEQGKHYQQYDLPALFVQTDFRRSQWEHILFTQGAGAAEMASLPVQFFSGRVRPDFRIGNGERQDLSPSLRGTWWESDTSLGIQTTGRLSARLNRSLTTVYLLGNLDHQSAVFQIVGELESSGWIFTTEH